VYKEYDLVLQLIFVSFFCKFSVAAWEDFKDAQKLLVERETEKKSNMKIEKMIAKGYLL